MTKRVLLLGGTGVFGRRLAEHLKSFEELELIVASRNVAKAKALANLLFEDNGAVSIIGIGLDHQHGFAEQLAELKPWAVVDCSGPFQEAGYEVAEQVLSAGAHYIDLADARQYLLGFHEKLNQIALINGVVGLTGASSTPSLSGAVVEFLTNCWRRVDTIDIAIVPGGKSEVGQSVIAAILSYVGKKIPVWREGHLTRIYGWSESHVISVHCFGKRRVAAVETVDAELLGQAHSVTSRVSFSAGLECLVEQLGLEGLGGLRRLNLLPSLKYLIPVLLIIRKITRMSMSDRGGMIVDVKGLDADGKFRRVRWSLLAIHDDGPFVPVMPAAAAIRSLLQGQFEPGAHIGSQELTLAAIKREMVTHSITTRSETVSLDQGVFEHALGQDRFDRLPPTLKAFHAFNGYPVWRGLADIDTGRGPISSLIAFFFRFPKTGRDVPVCVSVERVLFPQDERGPKEVWMRNFSGQCFSSKIEGLADGGLTERFGPFTFEIALTADDRGIAMPVRAWQFFGIALPKFLAPRSEASEFEDEECRFRFDIKLSLPLIGAIAHYRGWLKPNSGSN